MANLSVRWCCSRSPLCKSGTRTRRAAASIGHHDEGRLQIARTAHQCPGAEGDADDLTYRSRRNGAKEQSGSVTKGSALKRTYQLPTVVAVLGIWSLLQFQAPGTHAADALTQHYDNARLGAVLDETILTTATVNTTNFGKLWTLYADGQVVAQPLYVSALQVNTAGNPDTPLVQGTFNAIIVATMHNTVYVYDADKANPGANGRTVPLWAKWLGRPRPGGKDIDMWSTNDPEWGIVGTPVVSPDKRTLFVAAWHGDGPGGFRYMLHALDVQKGTDRLPPVVVGVAQNDPSNPCVAQNQFNPCHQKQRTALLLDGGVLYVAFGGDGNRGAIFAYDAATLTRRAFWSSTPTGQHGGIWQSGQGLSADAQGNIYLITGNGTFDANTGGQNFGNSFVKMKLEGSQLLVKDFFTPCNVGFLNSLDLDLGSGGPVLLPVAPPRIIGGGKQGILYVLARDNMGKHAAASTGPDCDNANIIQQVNAFPAVTHNGQQHYGNIHGSPVYWNGPDVARVYAWGENSRLKAFVFGQGRLQTANVKTSTFEPPPGMPGGMLALSANGRKANTGIVWAVVPLDGDANQQRGVKGIVLALDAQNVSRTLWTSEQVAQRDRLGLFAKFNPPVVAAGKVFVATYGDDEPRQTYGPPNSRPTRFPNYSVAVYGLLGPVPAPAVVVNQNRDDVTVVRASTSPVALDTAQCTPVDAGSVDCTEALAQSTGGAPALHRVVVGAGQSLAGCALLRVTTASKDTGLANASGVGFWSAQGAAGNIAPENSGRFVPKAAMKAVGTATLRNGAASTLHEFVGLSNCPLGNGTSFERLFKPYMQFEGAADGRIFRNWDLAENYRISAAITQFDRSAEVLRP